MTVTASAKVGDFLIANGTSVSNIITAREGYEDAYFLGVTSIDMGDAATFTLEVTSDPNPIAGSVWRTFQVLNGATLADFVIPNTSTKGYGLPRETLSFTGMRIKASGNVSADRTLRLSKQYGN